MKRDITVTGVLDEASAVVRQVSLPWFGILCLTLLPFRFLQAHFVNRLFQLGSESGNYASYLYTLAWTTAAAFALASAGRLAFARACSLALQGSRPLPGAVLGMPRHRWANYLYAALLVEFFTVLFAPVAAGLVAGPILGGLAVATAELNEKPGLLEPLRVLGMFSSPAKVLAGLWGVFLIGLLVAIVNIYSIAAIALWSAEIFPALNPGKWNVLVEGRLFGMLALAGALVVLEPFHIAAYVSFVTRRRAAESGEDLLTRFRVNRDAAESAAEG